MNGPISPWAVVIDRVLGWIERNLPGLIVAFGLGHRIGSKGKAEAEKQLELKEYENEKLKNEVDVLNGPHGRDVVDDFIKRNRK